MSVYTQFSYKPKSQITRGDIGKGQIFIEHLSPAVFLELQQIKLHQHTGVDSQVLPAEATPYMVRGFHIRERIERSISTWSGAADAAGSIDITFGTKFQSVPTVVATVADGDVDKQCVVGNLTTTGFKVTWKDDTGATHTSVPINWVAIGN